MRSSSRPARWERPQWYGSNADLVERYGVEEREVEWDNRWWSPITVGEHLNMRENVGARRPLRVPELRDLRAPAPSSSPTT